MGRVGDAEDGDCSEIEKEGSNTGGSDEVRNLEQTGSGASQGLFVNLLRGVIRLY